MNEYASKNHTFVLAIQDLQTAFKVSMFLGI